MVVRYSVGDADDRPWGRWEVLATGATYCCKRITVKPGGKLSLQLHHHREEHWTVVEGHGLVTCGDQRREVDPNCHVFIPLQAPHRIENPGTVDLVIIEVQHGDDLDENDIVRLDDVYGR
ncbi:MAG: cupin domain-containing protein [Rhizobiales bacterium]|nr:cupin domain-containing protein [Hyphomicrobiales bacterium]